MFRLHSRIQLLVCAAAFALPTVLLLYARHWGRLAWLSLNYLPRQGKRPRVSLSFEEPRFMPMG